MTTTDEHVAGFIDHQYAFDWSGLAFDSKKPLSSLKATFIAAPRKISEGRLKQLIKEHLPKGNLVIGIAKESYVDGLAPNPAFAMLQRQDIQELLIKVNAASSKHKIYTLHYFQRDLDYILQKVSFRQVLLVRGSWYMAFHLKPAYYTLAQNQIPFAYISPFVDETEAKLAATALEAVLDATYALPTGATYDETQLMTMADIAAQQSLEYCYQTGAVLAKKSGKQYKLLASSYNKVVPYQTYAMHFGNSREDNFSPPNDLNHYDAVHAEIMLIIKAATEQIKLDGTSLFINLMPCPNCARMLCESPIQEFVYREDHSKGYALQLLSTAGKQVRRQV